MYYPNRLVNMWKRALPTFKFNLTPNLSLIQSQKLMVSFTISGWLKTILLKSDVDTGTFKAH